MRFIETSKLNDYVLYLKQYLKTNSSRDFYENIDDVNKISLQEFSIEHDKKFLQEVQALFNVVITIIYHPHITNKREEVVIRVEQAQQLSREAFVDTIRDGMLWKKHGAKMIPEEVHYHYHVDELKIYENRFIVFLVGLIDRELAKFSEFYLLKLPSLASCSQYDRNEIGDIIVTIDRLRRKAMFIKNTRFYKEIAKEKPISPKVQPTNILLKDGLYRFCYRFYRDFVVVEDIAAAKANLRGFYSVLLFKAIKDLGFLCLSSDDKSHSFENDKFLLKVDFLDSDRLSLDVHFKGEPKGDAKHILVFCPESEVKSSEDNIYSDYQSIEFISLWELSHSDDSVPTCICTGKEENMIRDWLLSKITTFDIHNSVYERYCPICKSRELEDIGSEYVCSACSSRYSLSSLGDEKVIWFRKIRK